MTTLTYYVTVRSPYSYLSGARAARLADTPGVAFRFRPVYPLAIRKPSFFRAGDPLLLGYLRRDAERVAEMEGIPFAWPDTDPVLQDITTSEIAVEQPHVFRLTRLLAAAEAEGAGLAFYLGMSAAIFDGTRDWNAPEVPADVAGLAGLSLDTLQSRVENEAESLDAVLEENATFLQAAGHWGTPSLHFKDEIFFGQDRIAMCAWHMRQSGYSVSF